MRWHPSLVVFFQRRHFINESPYDPPQSTINANIRAKHRHGWGKRIACWSAWPAAVFIGWVLGDKQSIVMHRSIWTGPFPLTESPGFALLVLTLIAWMVGIVVTLSDRQRSVGYGLCILTAIIGGVFSFLLWFSINAI